MTNTEKESPNYYSIIPASVRYDKRISSSEKLFYSEITALSNYAGYCYASNTYFSKLYKVKNSTISLWVKKLSKAKHVKVEYVRKGKEIIKRKIFPLQNPESGYFENQKEVVRKSEEGYSENQMGVVRKSEEGYSENPKENTINTNTKKNIRAFTFLTFEEREKVFREELVHYEEKYGKELIREFFLYWSEKSLLKDKMKFELQTTWQTEKRLQTWYTKSKNFNPTSNKPRNRRKEIWV